MNAHIGTLDESLKNQNIWAERSQFWQAAYQASIPKRKRRSRQTAPLVLTGRGLSIRVHRGTLLIEDGLTHFPQDKREYRLFPGGLENPPRIVLVDGSGSFTLDALDWLAEQGIPLIRLKWDGSFLAIATNGGQSADLDKVRWQEATRDDPIQRAEFARKSVIAKAENALETVNGWLPKGERSERAREKIEQSLDTLVKRRFDRTNDLLGIEGAMAQSYFIAWRDLLLSWTGTAQTPIPDDWKAFKARTALRDEDPVNKNATHPINAMLNYAYAALISRKQIEAIADGFDPMLGIMHTNQKKNTRPNPGFVLDIIEADRPIVDRTILEIIRSGALKAEDFTMNSKGVCRVCSTLATSLVK